MTAQHTSTLTQLLQGLREWPPADLLQLLPALDLAVIIDLVTDVAYASQAVGVSVSSENGRESGSGAEHKWKASPCGLSVPPSAVGIIARTGNTNADTSDKAGNGLAVAVVLLSQVAGRVKCELICGSHAGCTPISSVQLRYTAIDQLRTI
jgi:hypothetical protein